MRKEVVFNRALSLDRPLKTGEDNFNLLDIIPSPEDEFSGISTEPKMKIKQARRSIEIDQDAVDVLRKQFGTMPLGRAIRIILGLKPKIAQNAWQEEEDALIREYYPIGGANPLAEYFGRKPHCVWDRASKLGVKRKWSYKRDRRSNK